MWDSEALRQDANIQGPRRGQGVAVATSAAVTAYDLRGLAWNGQSFAGMTDVFLYLDLQNDGANPIYYYFSTAADVDMNDGTVQTVGATLALTNAVPKVLRSAQDTPIRIQCDVDTFLILKSPAGASVLRIFPSSNSTVKVQ